VQDQPIRAGTAYPILSSPGSIRYGFAARLIQLILAGKEIPY
jgi:hypothetical protein